MNGNNLQNQTAIITGASGGIGRAIATEMAHFGTNLVLAARRERPLQLVAEELKGLGSKALVVPTDVTRRDQVRDLVAVAIAHLGRVDILVASAGQYVQRRVLELTRHDLDRSMSVNFDGAFYSTMAVLPHMLARQSGHIVFISSLDAKKAIPIDAPYVAAKCALTGMAEVMRQELHGTGVHITTVFPGRIDTAMLAHLDMPWVSPKCPPKTVARAVIRGIRQRKLEVVVPRSMLLWLFLNVLSPRFTDWFARAFHLEGQLA